jgi:NADH dehydrogenase
MTPTIAIFGGTGFLGRHIVNALIRDGFQIIIACRSPSAALRLKTGAAPGQVVAVACNVHDDASVDRIVSRATHVINLIGILFEKGRKNSFDNMHATVAARIAQTAARHGGVTTLLHVSALGADANGLSKYSRSKAAGEKAVLSAFPRATILRPSIVFGPEDNFFNLFAKMAGRTPFLPLIGGGKTLFQPVYVGDIAAAAATVMNEKTGAYAGKTFNAAGPQTLSFRALLEKMLFYTGQKALFIPLPFFIAGMLGAVLSVLPRPPLTADQVRSLKTDNIAPAGEKGLAGLGIAPNGLDAILPSYLSRYRSQN